MTDAEMPLLVGLDSQGEKPASSTRLLWLRPLDPTYRLNWPESNPDPGLEESH